MKFLCYIFLFNYVAQMDQVRRRNEVLLLLLLYIRKRKQKRNLSKSQRRYWIHPILRLKQQQGDWHNLINEMRLQRDETFFNYMRMTSTRFDTLLAKVGPSITKMETTFRTPIPAAARLAMTIRYTFTIYNIR